jgi:hypothetical protein
MVPPQIRLQLRAGHEREYRFLSCGKDNIKRFTTIIFDKLSAGTKKKLLSEAVIYSSMKRIIFQSGIMIGKE